MFPARNCGLDLLLQLFWQTETIDLTELGSQAERSSTIFRKSNLDKGCHSIDSDGLPHVGQVCHCLSSLFSLNVNFLYKKSECITFR